jgi:GT2 family glycosyltransferase
LEREPATSRILWLENDARASRSQLEAVLAEVTFPWVWLDPARDPLPGPGVVGVVAIPENLGYAGGNNVGLRFLSRHGVPWSWVINNDTLLLEGDSSNLVAAARARPEVGLWGTAITSDLYPPYFGGVIRSYDFRPRRCEAIAELEQHPNAFVSGCSLFLSTKLAAELNFIPEEYFLYFEDPAFSLEIKRRGLSLSGLNSVRLWHHESLSTGMRSHLMTFYNCRNRWIFVARYFPQSLWKQKLRRWLRFQGLFFRGRFWQIRLEWLGYQDFLAGSSGRTLREFSRSNKV